MYNIIVRSKGKQRIRGVEKDIFDLIIIYNCR